MKLLFDENLSHTLVGILAHEFPGCAHVRNTGLRASEDGKIWDHARTNGFVIISKDTDFRERSYVEGFPPKIFRSSGVALRRRRLDPMKKLVALSIGVLAAVKLLLRLQNRGKTVYAGDPHVWEIVEQASDDLAADHFQHIAGDFSSAGIPGMRLKGERAYLHLVQNRERFQWCPAQINDDETSPFPPGTMHEAVPEVGDAVTFAIIGSLAEIRQSLPKDADGQLNHTLAETVALVAAAKVHLAVCGNGKLAAGVERIADQVSEVLYKQYRT